MGYSFAAGTTDGPGAFDFTQGYNLFLNWLENVHVHTICYTTHYLCFICVRWYQIILLD